MRSPLVSSPAAEVQLKRPLGRAAPRLLLRRMNLDPKASVIDALCEATSRRGKVQRRAAPRAESPPPPPPKRTISRPVPPPPPAPAPAPAPAAGVRGLDAPTPPKTPHGPDLDLAIMLLGETAKGAVLRASTRDQLSGLLGTLPATADVAKRWKAVLKTQRVSAAAP